MFTNAAGDTRYEVRIETGKHDGKRQQQSRRFAKLQDAIDAYSGGRGDRSRGGHQLLHRGVDGCAVAAMVSGDGVVVMRRAYDQGVTRGAEIVTKID